MARNSGNYLGPEEAAKLHTKIEERLPFVASNSIEVLDQLGLRISKTSAYSKEYEMLVCKNGTCWICPKERGVVTFFPVSPHNRELAKAGKLLNEIVLEEMPHLDTSLG